jgi:hypothetical protein
VLRCCRCTNLSEFWRNVFYYKKNTLQQFFYCKQYASHNFEFSKHPFHEIRQGVIPIYMLRRQGCFVFHILSCWLCHSYVVEIWFLVRWTALLILIPRKKNSRLIRLQRIYNFWCSMLIFTPFAYCFVTLHGTFMRFLELTY